MTPSKHQAIQTALTGNWQNATSINKALLNQNPKDIEALNRLAFALTILGKIKDAQSTYKKVLEIDSLNPIALRNLKQLLSLSSKKNSKSNILPTTINHTFLEETGKTRIIELVNVAQPRVINILRIGQSLKISIKRSKIFVQTDTNQYIGVLPDDIGKRLIKLIKGGNTYQTYVKSVNDGNVEIFIKEAKRANRFKDQPSFLQGSERSLILDKNHAKNKTYVNDKSDLDQEDKNYLEDENLE